MISAIRVSDAFFDDTTEDERLLVSEVTLDVGGLDLFNPLERLLWIDGF